MAEIQSVLFLYMLIGWICRKTDLVKAAAQPSFTNFLLYVSIPCMVFQSFDMEFTMETLYRGASVLTIATISALVSLVFGRYAYNWCNPREKCIMKYGTLVSNSGFAGLPVIQDAYGQDGLFLGSLFIIPNRIMMWSAGISLFTDAPLKQRIKNVMLNPGIIAVELGVLRMLFQPAIPQQLNKALSALGAMSTPLGMVIIGMILSGVSPRTRQKGIYSVCGAAVPVPAGNTGDPAPAWDRSAHPPDLGGSHRYAGRQFYRFPRRQVWGGCGVCLQVRLYLDTDQPHHDPDSDHIFLKAA